MADLILVLNAGSSSIKFCAFDANLAEPELVLHGQVEGLYTAARFRAKDASGAAIAEHRWEPDAAFGHHEATEYIGDFLRSHREQHRLVAVGHRVVHGGLQFTGPVVVTPAVIDALDKLTPLAPLHQP